MYKLDNGPLTQEEDELSFEEYLQEREDEGEESSSSGEEGNADSGKRAMISYEIPFKLNTFWQWRLPHQLFNITSQEHAV